MNFNVTDIEFDFDDDYEVTINLDNIYEEIDYKDSHLGNIR